LPTDKPIRWRAAGTRSYRGHSLGALPGPVCEQELTSR